MKPLIRLLAVLLFAGAPVTAAPIVPKPIPGEPGSPVEAIELLKAAAKDGDADKFEARLGGHVRAAFKLKRVEENWQKALDESYGPEKDQAQRATVSDELKEFAARNYQVWAVKDRDANRKDLTVWVIVRGSENIREETWIALREGKGWLLVPSDRGYLEDATRTNEEGRRVKVTVVSDGGPIDPSREKKISEESVEMYSRMILDVRGFKYRDRSAATRASFEGIIDTLERAAKRK